MIILKIINIIFLILICISIIIDLVKTNRKNLKEENKIEKSKRVIKTINNIIFICSLSFLFSILNYLNNYVALFLSTIFIILIWVAKGKGEK